MARLKRILTVAGVTALMAAVRPSTVDAQIWMGKTNRWQDAANWQGGTVPNSPDAHATLSPFFDSVLHLDGGPWDVERISFKAGLGPFLTESTLQFHGDAQINLEAGTSAGIGSEVRLESNRLLIQGSTEPGSIQLGNRIYGDNSTITVTGNSFVSISGLNHETLTGTTRFVVFGGGLELGQWHSLGPDPELRVPDAITLDGGSLSFGFFTTHIHPNHGILIGSKGGSIAARDFHFDGNRRLSGSGPLRFDIDYPSLAWIEGDNPELTGPVTMDGSITIQAPGAQHPLGSGPLRVAKVLSGYGRIGNSSTTIEKSGNISAGPAYQAFSIEIDPDQTKNQLSFGGDLNIEGTYIWKLGAYSDSSGFPQLFVEDGYALRFGTDAKLRFDIQGKGPWGDKNPFWEADHLWRIIDVAGSEKTVGSLLLTSAPQAPQGVFTVVTDGGDGNDVELRYTANVPEPTTGLLVGFAFACLALRRNCRLVVRPT